MGVAFLLVGGASLIWGCGLSRGNNVLVFEDGKQQPKLLDGQLLVLEYGQQHRLQRLLVPHGTHNNTLTLEPT